MLCTYVPINFKTSEVFFMNQKKAGLAEMNDIFVFLSY